MIKKVFITGILGIILPLTVFAWDATSTSFFARQDVQTITGLSTSTTFQNQSGGGQSGFGISTSSSFKVFAGHLFSLWKDIKPQYTQIHFHWRNDDNSESQATSATGEIEDTALSNLSKNTVARLRVEITNNGGTREGFSTQQFRIEYGLLATTCANATYTDVGAVGGDWDMGASQLTEGSDTTNIAAVVGGVTDANAQFLSPNGGQRETTSQTGALSVASDKFVELEYAVQALTAATSSGTYCFRVTNAGSATNFVYTRYPTVTLASGANATPVVSAVTVNGSSAITLTENTSTSISFAGTVTDTDGFADIAYATGTLYRSGVGTACAADQNNCYRLVSSSCPLSSCGGNSCTATCSVPVQFFAEPTDAGAYVAETWQASITGVDQAGASGSATSASGVELNTLLALNVTASISYGSVSPGGTTGATNQTTTVTNTGNGAIDVNLSGTNLTSGSNTIAVGNQKYATSTFTYSSCTVCTALSTTPTQYILNVIKPTSATPSTKDVFWGLSVGTNPSGSYTGTNTFTAVTH